MRVKICGITNFRQGQAIANLGADTLGFIYVKSSPRYVESETIKDILKNLKPEVKTIGVVVNLPAEEIKNLVEETELTGIQLHGEESPQFCVNLRKLLPAVELIKAIRIKNKESLVNSQNYFNCVDALLLDAYDAKMHGGTGKTLNWDILENFSPPIPWFLAGGLTPDNINDALKQVTPDGIDLSSGVEISPGNKDLTKVAQLFSNLRSLFVS